MLRENRSPTVHNFVVFMGVVQKGTGRICTRIRSILTDAGSPIARKPPVLEIQGTPTFLHGGAIWWAEITREN